MRCTGSARASASQELGPSTSSMICSCTSGDPKVNIVKMQLLTGSQPAGKFATVPGNQYLVNLRGKLNCTCGNKVLIGHHDRNV
jgi:hypothetical protein